MDNALQKCIRKVSELYVIVKCVTFQLSLHFFFVVLIIKHILLPVIVLQIS